MDIQDYIEKIADNGDIESMRELSYMLEDAIEEVQKYDDRKYKKYAMKLYKLAYGETLNRELADDIVHGMKPYGMKWSLEEIRNMQNDYNINDLRGIDVYVVMNSAYNDYNDLFKDDIDSYIKFTVDFIEDEDAGDGKVFKYFTTIPRMEE